MCRSPSVVVVLSDRADAYGNIGSVRVASTPRSHGFITVNAHISDIRLRAREGTRAIGVGLNNVRGLRSLIDAASSSADFSLTRPQPRPAIATAVPVSQQRE